MKIRNASAIALGLAMVALITVVAWACERPPQPVCPEGQITITDAQWVDAVSEISHKEHQHYYLFLGWGPWELGKCHGFRICHERTVIDRPYAAGYWTAPVCELIPPPPPPPPVCVPNVAYRMWAFKDFDAPVGYVNGGTCYIISDEYPDPGIVNAKCGVCKTGFEYTMDVLIGSGNVGVGCDGVPYFEGDPNWKPEWFLWNYLSDHEDWNCKTKGLCQP